MHRTFAFLLCGTALSCLPVSAQQLPSDSAVRVLLSTVAADGNPGSIVAGLLDVGGSRVVSHGSADGSSVFEIGSITKVFTAILLADMSARGEVRLDQSVAELLPPGVRMPSRGGRAITLLDLATHRSGLYRMPDNFAPRDIANPYADYTVEQLYEFLNGYRMVRDPGVQYEYSNLGTALLGQALAARAGMDYEALLLERVLDQLGLAETRVALTDDMRARLAPGHGLDGTPASSWDLAAFAGAGGLRSTAHDMLRFLAANLDTAHALYPVLAETHEIRAPTGRDGFAMALGWHVMRREAGDILFHDGGTGGYRAFAGLVPERGVAVVLLTNSAQDVNRLGFHLLDPSVPLAGR